MRNPRQAQVTSEKVRLHRPAGRSQGPPGPPAACQAATLQLSPASPNALQVDAGSLHKLALLRITRHDAPWSFSRLPIPLTTRGTRRRTQCSPVRVAATDQIPVFHSFLHRDRCWLELAIVLSCVATSRPQTNPHSYLLSARLPQTPAPQRPALSTRKAIMVQSCNG